MRHISLVEDWTVEYFEPGIDTFEFAPSPQPITKIHDWRFSPRFAEAGYLAWLLRRFTLIPRQTCVSYALQIQGGSAMRVYLNDEWVAEKSDADLHIDVTHAVFLGENRLNIRVQSEDANQGAITQIQLIETPCDML